MDVFNKFVPKCLNMCFMHPLNSPSTDINTFLWEMAPLEEKICYNNRNRKLVIFRNFFVVKMDIMGQCGREPAQTLWAKSFLSIEI